MAESKSAVSLKNVRFRDMTLSMQEESFASLVLANFDDFSNTTIKETALSSSVVRAFAHGAMGCRIDPSWGGPIELFLVPASAPRLV